MTSEGLLAMSIQLSSAVVSSIDWDVFWEVCNGIWRARDHYHIEWSPRDWNTAAFATADLEIVEGLAQHYTKTICESTLATKFPQASEAYKALVNQQTDPYRIHEQWTDDKNEDKSGEIIRFTMINTRLKNIQNIDDFENERATVKKLVATKGR